MEYKHKTVLLEETREDLKIKQDGVTSLDFVSLIF